MNTTQESLPCGNKRNSTPSSVVFKRLLVAVDSSDQAEYAAEVAAQLADELRADVVLINVVQLVQTPALETDYVDPSVRVARIDAANALLNRIKQKMGARTRIETVLRDGDPATEILNAAILFDANLIIMGTHARGRLAQVVLGSVARAVTHKAHCPVLTVARPPAVKAPTPVAKARASN